MQSLRQRAGNAALHDRTMGREQGLAALRIRRQQPARQPTANPRPRVVVRGQQMRGLAQGGVGDRQLFVPGLGRGVVQVVEPSGQHIAAPLAP